MKSKYSKVFHWVFVGILLFSSGCTSSMQIPSSVPPTETTISLPEITVVPTLTPAPSLTPAPTPSPSPTAAPSPTPLAEHRIGVRYVDGLGEFYDRFDNSKFVPRGMNYARLDHRIDGKMWHSTFDPALYDTDQIDEALHRMEVDGFNVVRVFIDCCSAAGTQVGDPSGGLSDAYMANVADFLMRAKAHHIYVILITDLTPAYGGYNDILWKDWFPDITGNNLRYLTNNGLLAKINFELDFVRSLIEHHAPLDAIFAYDMSNEAGFDTFDVPFSLSSGLVTTGNGHTYDMAKPGDKARMASENLVYWIDTLRQRILQLDPTALVEVSFYGPFTPVPSLLDDSYISVPEEVIANSQADFIDVHPYPGAGFDLPEYARYYGITADTPKPVLMGEFGAKSHLFDTAADAAQFLQNWQIESCRYGYDGWLLWTWDSEDFLWNALSENGEIEQALAPLNHPDPCR